MSGRDPIGTLFAMTAVEGVTLWFCNLEPVDSHLADDVRARTLRIARRHVDNRLRQSELSETFGVSLPTIRAPSSCIGMAKAFGFSSATLNKNCLTPVRQHPGIPSPTFLPPEP